MIPENYTEKEKAAYRRGYERAHAHGVWFLKKSLKEWRGYNFGYVAANALKVGQEVR